MHRLIKPVFWTLLFLAMLLVIDQFEELFTQCRDPAQRRAFIDNLLTAPEPPGAAASLR